MARQLCVLGGIARDCPGSGFSWYSKFRPCKKNYKACDTVHHYILLGKVEALGFNDNTLHWFESYLGDGKQVV